MQSNIQQRTIGLDWDGTSSCDIELFLAFVKLARSRGHKVYIVTMRYQEEINDPNYPNRVIPDYFIKEVDGLICTNRQAKRKVVEDLGIKIDVWFDDNPEAVYMSASQIWGQATPKGVIIDNAEEARAYIEKQKSLSN